MLIPGQRDKEMGVFFTNINMVVAVPRKEVEKKEDDFG